MEYDDGIAAGFAEGTTYQVKLHAYKVDPVSDCKIRDLWLSGIVVHGREYVYSQAGIESFRPRCTLLGEPTRVELLGETEVPNALLLDFVIGLSASTHSSAAFCLGSNDFNSFAADVAAFACGARLPEYLGPIPGDLTAAEKASLAPLLAAESFGDPEADASASVISFARQKAGAWRKRSEDLEVEFQARLFQKVPSPEFDEIEAEIQALKLEQKKLYEKREQLKQQHEEEYSIELQKEAIVRNNNPEPQVVTAGAKCKKEKKDKKRKKKERKGSASDSNLLNRKDGEKPKHPAGLRRSATTDGTDKGIGNKKKVSFCGIPEGEETAPAEPVTHSEEEENSVEGPLIVQKRKGSPQPFKVITNSDITYSPKETEGVQSNCESAAKHSESELNSKNIIKSQILHNGDSANLEEEVAVTNGVDETNVEPIVEVAKNLSEEEEGEDDRNSLAESHAKRREEFSQRINQIQQAMSEAEEGNNVGTAEIAEEGGAAPAKKKEQKPSEPPITFREFEHVQDFEDLVRTIVTLVDPEDQDRLREMEDWIIKNEGTWVLSEGFNSFLGRVLHNKNLPSEGRVAMLRLLAYGAGQDDIVLIMHSDRKDHLIMNYAQQFDRLPIKEQEATAVFFANLFEHTSSAEWLLYISEWTTGGAELSNIRVTTKVAVNALLGDTPSLRDYGTAIMHNLGTKEVKAVVFDDICTELAMAILQFFQNEGLPEEQVFRCLKALNKFSTIAHRDVPQLIKMIGPDPSVKFRGMSPRCDQMVETIGARVAAAPSF